MLSLEQPADAQPQRRARRPAAGLIFLAAVVAIIALIGIFLIVIQGTPNASQLQTIRSRNKSMITRVRTAFTPDSTALIGPSGSRAVTWQLGSGKELQSLQNTYEPDSWLHDLQLSPDASMLMVGGDSVIIWDRASGRELLRIPNAQAAKPFFLADQVAFSPDGRRIAAGSTDATAGVWDVQSGAQLYRLDGHTDTVSSVSFSPDGRYVATNSHDGNTIIWQVADETP